MEVVSGLAIAGTVAALVNNLAIMVMDIKRLHDQFKSADAQLMSFVAQLSTIKAALVQIQDLLQTAQYNEQLQMDLELALQATQLHIDFIESKLSKFKTKNAASTLRFGNKVKMVFESEDMQACLQRLNHQATALNLLITVLTSKSVTEQKAMLQRSITRRVFRQIQEDNSSLLDETSSMCVQRDNESVRNAIARTKSEPFITKNPWKRFPFDSQVLGSRAYTGKLFRRQASGKNVITEEVSEMDSESVQDDATTLVADSELESIDAAKPKLDLKMADDIVTKPPRFSKMLAFGHEQSDVSNIVAHAQRLWNASDATKASHFLARKQTSHMHRLSTRYFDLSISAHTLDEYHGYGTSEELLHRYRDVSSILFIVNLSVYPYDNRRLDRDLELFARTANDYNLWLAKIILFLETTNLDPYSARGMSEDVKQRFMKAGRAGINDERIHVVVGESDEMAAGTIFAVCNESERMQENKWAGLTKSPTY